MRVLRVRGDDAELPAFHVEDGPFPDALGPVVLLVFLDQQVRACDLPHRSWDAHVFGGSEVGTYCEVPCVLILHFRETVVVGRRGGVRQLNIRVIYYIIEVSILLGA